MSLYFIGEMDPRRPAVPNGIVKIGYTRHESADGRLSVLQCGNARPLRVLKRIKGDRDDEYRLHGLLADWRLEGEWFAFSSHALRVLTWKRVACPRTFIAALGTRYAYERGAARRRREEAQREQDAAIVAARVGDDSRAPAWLAPVIDPGDDGPASGGAALPHPVLWARRVEAAGVLMEAA